MRLPGFHHVPIHRKLVIAIFLANLVAAAIAVIAVIVYETETFRPAVLTEVRPSVGIGILLSAVLLALVTISLLASRATRRLIVAPLWELSSTAQRVTVAKDYSVRAEVRDSDEIGALTETFNGMLDTIEENVVERRRAEAALREHTQDLEERVERRTRELRTVQERLIRQERLAFLGQLAGGVSHELRRPLSTIGNAVYFLRMIHGTADERTREHLEIIRTQINTMDKIIYDLLDSLRIRPEAVGDVNLGTWIAGVLARHPAPQSVKVVNRVDTDPASVWMDSSQLEQVVSNLVSNAYQAMPDGGELNVDAVAEEGGISLSLRDTGCGISEEHLKTVFEPLFTTKSRGIGLGLTISKNFVEANGGRLQVESVEGEGTTFRVFLPSQAPSHLRNDEDV